MPCRMAFRQLVFKFPKIKTKGIMGDWWYAVGMQRNGPTDEATLIRLLQQNAISQTTLVWREGMDNWVPLSAEPALEPLLRVLPPPLPGSATEPAITHWPGKPTNSQSPAALTLESVHAQDCATLHVPAAPWRRWLARMFDLWLAIFVVALLAFLAGVLWPSILARWSGSSSSVTLLTLALVPLALVLDAVVHALCGNTAGKALLCLRVLTPDDTRPGFSNYLGRNLALWGSGLAFCLPLFPLFTMAYQYRRLRRGEPTTYDGSDYRVSQLRVGLVRAVIFTLAFMSMLVLNGVLSAVAGHAIRDAEKSEVLSTTASSQVQIDVNPTDEPFPHASPTRPSCAVHFYQGSAPRIENPKLAQGTSSLCYHGASITFSGLTRTALWSAEHITADKLVSADKLGFNPAAHPESALSEADRATAADYDGSGFGMVPLTLPSRLATIDARVDSASLANVVPVGDSALAILWRGLGEEIANLARNGGDLYVVSGTLFEGDSLRQINGRVLVPTALYLAYYDARADKVNAYLLENHAGAEVHAIDLGELQRRASVTLFPALPPAKPAMRAVPAVPAAPAANATTAPTKKAVVNFSSCEKPTYPAASARNMEEGTVQIAFLVDAHGTVRNSRIQRSSGSSMLDQATRDAIKVCTFTPAERSGKPIESWVTIDYVWSF